MNQVCINHILSQGSAALKFSGYTNLEQTTGPMDYLLHLHKDGGLKEKEKNL